MDGFAIIGDTGYSIRHEQNNTLAQLYAIDLINATPTRIGTGYSIDGTVYEKTLGLATDGVNLYSLRYNGQCDILTHITGQVVSVFGYCRPLNPSVPFRHGENLAFAKNKLWSLSSDSQENTLYSLDPFDGAVTLVQYDIPIPSAISLTATSYPVICPDLVVADIVTDPSQPGEGQPVTLLVTVRNQGTVDAGSFNIDWYAGRTTPPSMGEFGDERTMITSLQAGPPFSCWRCQL